MLFMVFHLYLTPPGQTARTALPETFGAIFRCRWDNYVKILNRINQDEGFIRVNMFIFDRPCFKLPFVLKNKLFQI